MIWTALIFALAGFVLGKLFASRKKLGLLVVFALASAWGWFTSPLDGFIQFDMLLCGYLAAWILSTY